jgi:serine/threonine-protein kinase
MLNNRYRLLELVGSGGMAVVYKGVDTLLQRRVAVKILRESFAGDPAFLARFQREARAAAGLDHPNIVTVYDVGHEGDRHYIVMEYVDGVDLKTLIRQKGRLSVNEALNIGIQIAAGVGHAHKAGVIHCDIKPQNVLVTSDGRAKVTDFGIARALSEAGLTESETVWGSPPYFSPEQAAGDPLAPASDVYSIGIVLYEMLAGNPPFQAEKPAALALMHMREEPPPLAVRNPQVPPQLEWIIRKVLAKEPSARYRTAEQLAHVLEEYRRHGEQVTGWQPVTPAPPARAEPQPGARAGPEASPDMLTWMLGAIALVAWLGLVPLGWLVVQGYSAKPPLLPTATPPLLATFTPVAQAVPVANVVGKPMDEARTMLADQGLRLVVSEERNEPGVDSGVVLEQSPAAGTSVPLNSDVSVVVSGAGREVTMPNVVGYRLEVVQDGLESNGLNVAVEEKWSTQPERTVLAQQPLPDARLHAGDVVTLTVSGGVDVPIPLNVNLADLMVLKSAEVRQQSFRPGNIVAVTLRWQALFPIGTHYVVFVHLIGPSGRLVAQQDVEPFTPTTQWTPGIEIVDPHQVQIPADQPAGWYQIRVGMYPQGQPVSRLPVLDAGLTTVESDSILIAEIEVKP